MFAKVKLLVLPTLLLWLQICAFSLHSSAQAKQDSIINQINELTNEAAVHYKNYESPDGIVKLQEALSLYQKHGIDDKNLLFGIYVNLSDFYVAGNVSDSEKSAEYIEKAQLLAKEEGEGISAINLINFNISLGANENEIGYYDKALGFINIAKKIYNEREKEVIDEIGLPAAKELKANMLEWNVSISFGLGNESDLLEAQKELKQFYSKNKTNAAVMNYYGLGSFRVGRYYQPRDADKAEYFFNEAEKYADKVTQFYANVCKGFAFITAERYNDASRVVNRLEEFDDLNKFQELNVHEIAARSYAETKQISKLIRHTNRALTLLNANGEEMDVLNFKPEKFTHISEYKYPILLNQFALFLEKSGDKRLLKTANQLYDIGLSQFDKNMERQPVDKHLQNYDIIKNRSLTNLILDNATRETKQSVLAKIERIENRNSLNRLLFNRNLAENKSKLDDLLVEESKVRDEITALKQEQVEKDSVHTQELFELDLRLKDIEEQIVNENPTFYNLNSTSFDFATINVAEDTKIIHFMKAEDELFRAEISADDVVLTKIGEYEPIKEEIDAFYDSIKDYQDVATFNELSEKLYKDLLNDVSFTSNTIFVADAGLRNLPFELLKSDQYLIENTAVAYVPALSYLNDTAYEKQDAKENVAFFAPTYNKYLPTDGELAVRGDAYSLDGALNEVEVLSKLVGGTVYDKNKASKTEFFKLGDNTNILHIAGHAFLNNEDPELSNIVFSDNEEDNKLFISELYGFRSNAQLAVLSACNTGVGGYGGGQGMVSLSEAFMYSGIPSCVSSLWSAPDQSTKEIMIAFYKHLKEGQPKSKALQHAKLDYLASVTDPKLKHPFYWAGFVLYGNDAPVAFKNANTAYFPWLLGALGLLIVAFFLFRRKKSV